MNGWSWQAWVGLVGGSFIFFAVLGPVLLLQIRRYGQMSFPRVLGAAAVSIYTVALVAYTLLPLPGSLQNCGTTGGGLELVPGHSFADIARETAGLSLMSTLTSHAVLQVVMNVVLFIPLGAIVRGFWGRRLALTIVLGMLVSLLIEITQYTGIWGIYACSYRVADVDDLVANTIGTALGGVLAPFLLAWMPSSRALTATRNEPKPITIWRRWFGMAFDAIAVQLAYGLVAVAFFIWDVLAEIQLLPSVPVPVQAISTYVLVITSVVVLPALSGSGASIGQRLVFLAPHRADGPPTRLRRLIRAASVAIPYVILTGIGRFPELDMLAPSATRSLLAMFCVVVVSIAVSSVLATRKHRGLSYVVAGLDLRDTRASMGPTVPRTMEDSAQGQ